MPSAKGPIPADPHPPGHLLGPLFTPPPDLAPFATRPGESRGRFHPETESPTRTCYSRDRDRIIHSSAFRRLKHKTQVFVQHEGDYFRTRLTHSVEVAQLARSLARNLALDEDLAEVVALAHDLGHTPFGHSGEEALNAVTRDIGGFDHNAHALRLVTKLEHRYADFDGLNLTWETLEGLAKHNGPVRHPGWALAEADAAFPLDLATWPSLEAQVAALADDIAYDNHDIDDGLRAGLLTLDQLCDVPLVAQGWQAVGARFPGVPHARLAGELVRSQIGAMVNDVIAETRAAIAASGVASVGDVRAAREALVRFSPGMRAAERDLKRFMYANLYHHPRQLAAAESAGRVVAGLFAAYRDDPALMTGEWRTSIPMAEPARGRHIADFIAGMTDRYAITRYREAIGPIDLPEGF